MINCLSCFLWTGTMLPFFHFLGKHSLSRQFLKRIASGFEIEEARIFIVRIDISSCPWALFGSNDLIIFTISPEQIWKVDNLSSVTKLVFAGIAVVYRHTLLTKVIITQIAFTKKSETNWLPTNNGSISGILVPFTNVLVFSNRL